MNIVSKRLESRPIMMPAWGGVPPLYLGQILATIILPSFIIALPKFTYRYLSICIHSVIIFLIVAGDHVGEPFLVLQIPVYRLVDTFLESYRHSWIVNPTGSDVNDSLRNICPDLWKTHCATKDSYINLNIPRFFRRYTDNRLSKWVWSFVLTSRNFGNIFWNNVI